ncbi:MAG: hypothetical protein JO206_09350 [Solirubrobacterales bacterium]|nr:hypothetical protein [Solirubrobacterales bacterium]MBV9473163.1 hypothetical protein [Solirubrobacterales bacterium]MBV9836857.1 hypothetical protein [Solirubrobacterales bacterium]
MHRAKRSLFALLLLAAGGLAACGTSAQRPIPPSALLEQAPGTYAGRIVLSAVGAERIGVQTTAVQRAGLGAGAGATAVIPYSAIVYSPDGSTFAFTNPAPLVFTEVPIDVDHIDGGTAYLTKGPRVGARVVTVGAEELFGVQTGVLAQT